METIHNRDREAYNECEASVKQLLLAFASEWGLKADVNLRSRDGMILQELRGGKGDGYPIVT